LDWYLFWVSWPVLPVPAWSANHIHPFRIHSPEGRKAFLMKRLERKLDLTAQQREQVAAIVDRRHAEAWDHFRQHRDKLKKFIAQSFAEIRQVLDPIQQPKRLNNADILLRNLSFRYPCLALTLTAKNFQAINYTYIFKFSDF
jgi:hypothetical protein